MEKSEQLVLASHENLGVVRTIFSLLSSSSQIKGFRMTICHAASGEQFPAIHSCFPVGKTAVLTGDGRWEGTTVCFDAERQALVEVSYLRAIPVPAKGRMFSPNNTVRFPSS